MIVGTGIDIIEISRVKKAIEGNDKFMERLFTENEILYFNSRNLRTEVIAGNFAAKEAIVKALAVGLRGFEWKDIEVLRDSLGKPYALLHNTAKNFISDRCLIHVSISHCQEYATATAIIEVSNHIEHDEFNYMVATESL